MIQNFSDTSLLFLISIFEVVIKQINVYYVTLHLKQQSLKIFLLFPLKILNLSLLIVHQSNIHLKQNLQYLLYLY